MQLGMIVLRFHSLFENVLFLGDSLYMGREVQPRVELIYVVRRMVE